LRIPPVPQAKFDLKSAEECIEAALNWEQEVTAQITRLMDIAVEKKDYLGQNFLDWFIDEQLEEITKMDGLLSVVRRAGEKNLLMVEAYLAHMDTE
jgi:ferritin